VGCAELVQIVRLAFVVSDGRQVKGLTMPSLHTVVVLGTIEGGRGKGVHTFRKFSLWPSGTGPYSCIFDSHHIWLRDHCRCPQCFHPVTKQRLVDTFDVRGVLFLL
jgi:Gamma-butyrobetaine hydroxylase-like, N-terminal